MTTTIRTTRIAIMLTAAALVTAAQAQTYRVPYGQPPLYPYVAAQQQPYAVEVAPGVYVIQRPAPLRAYPYVREQSAAEDAKPSDRPSKPADRALIEELRKRYEPKETTIETKKVVREAPVVRETTRVVDDPPRVIERRDIVEDAAAPSRPKRRAQAAVAEGDDDKPAIADDGKARVIRAEAEITILGPDRMSIRLFRKRHGAEPEAKAQPGE